MDFLTGYFLAFVGAVSVLTVLAVEKLI